MALPTVVINSTTGSDTAASGAGPSTALAGSLAATHTSGTVNITDAVALGGVAVDGSALLWVETASGRQFSAITAITGTSGAWVVTVATAYAGTASAQSWAIGGQRASLHGSLQLGLDLVGGWTIDVQTGDTLVANFAAAPAASVANLTTTITSSATVRPVITTSTNNVFGIMVGGANNLVISHLNLSSTAGTPGDGVGTTSAAANYVTVQDCVISGFSAGIRDHDPGGSNDIFAMVVAGCEVAGCGYGIFMWAGAQVSDCYLHDNSLFGFYCSGTRQRDISLWRVICDNNTGFGAELTAASQTAILIEHCNFTNTQGDSGTGPGLFLDYGQSTTLVIKNCVFYGNFKYGIQGGGSNMEPLYLTNNAFGGNGTADTANITQGTGFNPITLTVSPFNSSTDFGLNSTAGGGLLCRGAAVGVPNASQNPAGDVGAIPSGGGGSGVARVMTRAVLLRPR
jgi:Right handed beta helix region